MRVLQLVLTCTLWLAGGAMAGAEPVKIRAS